MIELKYLKKFKKKMKNNRLAKKLSVNVLSLVMAAGLLLLVVPFLAIAFGREEPEPSQKGDFRLFKGFYAATQVILTEDSPEFVTVTAEAGEAESYQWQVYSTQEEKYIALADRIGKEFSFNAELAAQYDYGDGRSYFRCLATDSEGKTLTSDVLTVVLPEKKIVSKTNATPSTVETVSLTEPTEATDQTNDPTIEPTAEMTEPTTETTQPEKTDEPSKEKQSSDDGASDLSPIRGRLLEPLRSVGDSISITFNLNGGTDTTFCGQTVSGGICTVSAASGSALLVDTPIRELYYFTGWTATVPSGTSAEDKTALETGANDGNLTVPDYAVTFTANWERTVPENTKTSYIIEYYLDDPDTGEYSAVPWSTTEVSNVTPGTTVTLTSAQRAFGDTSMTNYVVYNTAMSNEIGPQVIKADGSTVFRVYYKRKTYSITFNIRGEGLPSSLTQNPVITYNSQTYTTSYTVSNIRYGQSIASMWPVNDMATTKPKANYTVYVIIIFTRERTYYIGGVKNADGTTLTYVPSRLTSEVIGNGSSSSYTLPIVWVVGEDTGWLDNEEADQYTVNYTFQNLNAAGTGVANTYSNQQSVTVYAENTNSITIPSFEGFITPSSPYSPSGKTVTYRYNRARYTINYLDSEVSPVNNVYYGTNLSGRNATPPARSGYVFRGWYTDSEYTTPMNWSGTMPAHDLNVYAKWETENTVLVYLYKDDGGTLQTRLAELKLPSGTTAAPNSAIQNRSRAGYTFDGWYYMNGSTESRFTFNSTRVNSDITVYGKWSVNRHDLKFLNTDSAYQTANNRSVAYGTSLNGHVPSTDPTKTGYTFDGWYANESCTTAMNWNQTMPDNDVNVYAKWKINSHKVKYNNTDIADATVVYGTSLSGCEPAAPSKTGYTFGGWYSDENCTTAMNWEQTMPDSDVNVYAKWTVNNHKLKFNNTDIPDADVDYGTLLDNCKPTTDPTKTGYDFVGWYSDPECTTAMNWIQTMPDSDMNVYAKWVKQQYNVTFHSSLAYAVTNNNIRYRFDGVEYETCIDGNTQNAQFGILSTQRDTDTEAFDGWYYDADHPDAPVSPVENEVRFNFDDDGESAPVRSAMRIYAKWIPKHTVTFYNDKVDGAFSDQLSNLKVKEGDTISIDDAPTPSKEGYTFVKWCYGEDNPYFDDGGTSVPMGTEDVSVYAEWVKNEISLTITNSSGDNVFTVTRDEDAHFRLRVAVPGGGSTTITHLPFDNYTVTSETWDYRNVTGSSSSSVDASDAEPGDNYSVSFSGSPRNLNWLGGDTRNDNRFGAIG